MKPTEMRAVRVKVKLTNAIDEAMVSRGVLAPYLLRECEKALVDTGALTLVIPQGIVQLGLRIRSQQIARYADKFEEPIGVTEPVTIVCEGLSD